MTDITLSTLATIYGCCGLFDLCSDNDLMSLSFEGQSKFLDWIGWERSNVCMIRKNFITYMRAEHTGGAHHASGDPTPGYIQDPCGDSNGVEWGVCDFTLEDFGLLRRHGPERNATNANLKLCDMQPRYRLDGTPITSDVEFDMRLTVETIIQDLKRMLINGNKTTAGHFDGLQRLVKTGYTNASGSLCQAMDSIVIDWNGNGMAGGNGITWNGIAVANTYAFVDVLIAAVRRIRRRIAYAPALASQGLSVGDIIFVAPQNILDCLLDAYTCWSVCPGVVYSSETIWKTLGTYEARTFRNQLNGGMFGAGRIFVDGFEIPLCEYDWGLLDTTTDHADAYLLTGKIGAVKTISGQYHDLNGAVQAYPDAQYSTTDGGRLLTWLERQKTCVYREVEMQPRLLMWAPWAQARFQDIDCAGIGGFLSPDPFSKYYPMTSFSTPVCP